MNIFCWLLSTRTSTYSHMGSNASHAANARTRGQLVLCHSSERFQSSGEYAVFAKPNRNRVAPPPTLPLGRTLPHALKRSIICTSHLVPARERASPVLFHLGGSVSWQLWALPFRRGAVAWRAWPATVASACASSAGACPRNVPLMSWAAHGRASLWDAQARCACLVGLGRFGDACSPCQWGLLALRRPLRSGV